MRRAWMAGMFAATLGVTLVPGGSAVANVKTVHDARDAKGDSVDIRSASAEHRGRSVVHVVDAYDGFRTKEAPCLHLRTSADGRGYEVCGNGRLRPNVVDQRPGTGKISVERPAEDRIVYVIPLRKMGNPGAYWWIVVVECACDFAPNRNEVKHTL